MKIYLLVRSGRVSGTSGTVARKRMAEENGQSEIMKYQNGCRKRFMTKTIKSAKDLVMPYVMYVEERIVKVI